jgi:pyruvate dehydrogenase E1 component alpha subunit
VAAVHAAVSAAVRRARERAGPTLIECLTYRRTGHKRDQAADYRPSDEVETWLALDPIPRFRVRLTREGIIDEPELADLEAEVGRRLDEAVERALAAAAPEPRTGLT